MCVSKCILALVNRDYLLAQFRPDISAKEIDISRDSLEGTSECSNSCSALPTLVCLGLHNNLSTFGKRGAVNYVVE